MDGRWSESVSGYPTVLITQLRNDIKECGLIWIEENLPLCCFKPLFMKEAK